MESRLYKPEDYTALKPWWDNHWGGAPEIEMLPLSGVIISGDDFDMAAGWLYMDMTTSISFIAWFVSNPLNTARESKQAMVATVEALEALARSQDRTAIITCMPKGGLSSLLVNNGYKITDSGMEHLAKELK